MHSGMLQVANASGEAEKMSKSLNNFILLHEALEQVRPSALRMLVLQTHYRSPLVFGQQRLEEADSALKRIENTIHNIDWSIKNSKQDNHNVVDSQKLQDAINQTQEKFVAAMDDDFNCSKALGVIFALVSAINHLAGNKELGTQDVAVVKSARDKIVELMNVFGVVLEGVQGQDDSGAGSSQPKSTYPEEVLEIASKYAEYEGKSSEEAINKLLEVRTLARKNKQFDVADGIRDELAEIGLTIEDTPQGPRIAL